MNKSFSKKEIFFIGICIVIIIVIVGLFGRFYLSHKKGTYVNQPQITTQQEISKNQNTSSVPQNNKPTTVSQTNSTSSNRYRTGDYGVAIDTTTIRTKLEWSKEFHANLHLATAKATVNGRTRDFYMLINLLGKSNDRGLALGGFDSDKQLQVLNIKNMRNERDSIARLIVLELYERGDIHLIQKLEIEQYHNKRH